MVVFSRFNFPYLLKECLELFWGSKEIVFLFWDNSHLLEVWVNSFKNGCVSWVWCPFSSGVFFVYWLQNLSSFAGFLWLLLRQIGWFFLVCFSPDLLGFALFLVLGVLQVSESFTDWCEVSFGLKTCRLLFFEFTDGFLIKLNLFGFLEIKSSSGIGTLVLKCLNDGGDVVADGWDWGHHLSLSLLLGFEIGKFTWVLHGNWCNKFVSLIDYKHNVISVRLRIILAW